MQNSVEGPYIVEKLDELLHQKVDKDTYDDLCVEIPKLIDFDDFIYFESCIACKSNMICLACAKIYSFLDNDDFILLDCVADAKIVGIQAIKVLPPLHCYIL